MAKKIISEKYNEACIKIFSLISLFASGNAAFSDVIKLFADEDGTIKQKSNVQLNKYMNTLDIFGIKIEKEKGIYTIIKMPFSISLTEDELYAVALLKSALNYLPSGSYKTHLKQFLEELEKRYDNDTKKLNSVVINNRNYDMSFYFMRYEKQIASCEKYCKEGNKLEISFINSDNTDETMMCIPLELKYLEKEVCFSVYNILTRQIVDLRIDKIRNIKLIRTNVKNSKICTSVIFKINKELAKNYKLREWEKVSEKDSEGNLIIVNSGENFNSLALRLFKYHESCEVLAPKYLKNKIIKMIENTLKNYE